MATGPQALTDDTAERNARLAALLGRCALRDRAAFAELYRRTSPKLFGVAVRILRNDDRAEEVLQESYMSIWNHATDYASGRSAPLTWMSTIVRNRCLDLLRRPQQETGGEQYELAAESWPDDAPGPLEQLAQSANAAALARCLGTLEHVQRQSIALAFYHGLSHSELATHLKQPLGTVKTWIRRGLDKLKTCMGAA